MRRGWPLLLAALALLPAVPAPADATDVRILTIPAEKGYGAAALRDAYALGDLTGAGVRVAIVTWGPADQASFDSYADANGLPRTVLVHHGDCSGPVLDEWNLDVQMVKAAAPLADIHVHCAPSATFGELRAALGRAIQDAQVVSLSWGTCEPRVPAETAAAYAEVFLDAAARGVAVFAASGDGGSRECTRWNVNEDMLATLWPAVDPRVVAVGGTRLDTDADAWVETAWNTCAPCPQAAWSASGGGVSALFEAPYWLDAGPRRSPDVAAVADRQTGVAVRTRGQWIPMGGTSAAAPLWAGTWAALVAELGPLGPPGPLLSGAAATFRDVTVGTNGDFAAGPGRDLVTGLGAPQALALRGALAALPAAPAGLVASRGPERGEVTLAWDPVEGAAEYVVLRGARRGAEVPLVAVGDTAFRDAGLGDGAVVSYRVAARGPGGTGPATGPIDGRTLSGPDAPSAPSWRLDGTRVVLVWSAPADDGGLPVVYRVWRAAPGGEPVLAAETAALEWEDDGCVALCVYAVSARNEIGEGARSAGTPAPANLPR